MLIYYHRNVALPTSLVEVKKQRNPNIEEVRVAVHHLKLQSLYSRPMGLGYNETFLCNEVEKITGDTA